jgi:diguanylate cyclase (GGDEF)-like protein
MIHRSSIIARVKSQINVIPRRNIAGRVCSAIGISQSLENVRKVRKIILPTLDFGTKDDTGTNKIKKRYLRLAANSLHDEFDLKEPVEIIENKLFRAGLTVLWDRDKAITDMAKLLKKLAFVRNIPQISKVMQEGMFNLCSNITVYVKDVVTGKIERLGNEEKKPPCGEVALIILRAEQIQEIIATAETEEKKREYFEKAIFYSTWHVKDPSYLLEWGIDENVLNKFKQELNSKLDQISANYQGSSLSDEAFREIIETERQKLFMDMKTLTDSVKSILFELINSPIDKIQVTKALPKFKIKMIAAIRESLDAAYKVAESNIEKWSKAKKSEKKHLDLSIKESFLNRKIFPDILSHYREAMEDRDTNMATSPDKSKPEEKVLVVICDDDLNVMGVVSGDNFEKNREAGRIFPIFSSLEQKQRQLLQFQQVFPAIAKVFQREKDAIRIGIMNRHLENDKRDLELTLQMSNIVNDSKLSLKERLDGAAERVHEICKKDGINVGCSIMVVDRDNPNILQVAATYNKHENVMNATLKIGEGIAGYVAQNRNPLFIRDIDEDNTFLSGVVVISQVERRYSSRSFMSIPMMVGEQLIGVLNIDGPGMTGNEQDIMQNAAHIIASGINNYWLSACDDLTRLYNKRRFNEDYSKLLNLRSEQGSEFSILMLDLDKFKSKNDTYGHLVGDAILSEIGRIIRKVIGKKGEAYRAGGEEITILLSCIDKTEAKAIAEGLRAAIENSRFSKKNVECTASFGISSSMDDYDPNAEDPAEDLLKKADKALYQAKNDGRNVVRIWGIDNITVQS